MEKQWIPCVVLGALTASLGLADEWNKTFTVTGRPDLRVNTTDGSITVRAWNRNEISARVTTHGWQIRPSEVRVNDHQGGDRVEIEVITPKEYVSFGHHSVELELMVPRELRAEIHTHDGRISAHELNGEIRLSTGDGSIEANSIDGSLEAKTGDGSIRASGRWDHLDLRTEDGSVEAGVRAGSKMTSAWSVHTGDGHVTLRLPDNFAADVNAHTGDGKVTVDFPLTISGSVGGSELRGKLNGGGEPLILRTGDGPIRLERL